MDSFFHNFKCPINKDKVYSNLIMKFDIEANVLKYTFIITFKNRYINIQ